MYQNIEEQYAFNCLWVLPYHFHNRKRTNTIGFICEDQFTIYDSYSPVEYFTLLDTWSSSFYDALNYKDVLPDTEKTMVDNCNACGYTFLKNSMRHIQSYLITNPVMVSESHLQ